MTQTSSVVAAHAVGRPSGRAHEPLAEGWAVRDGSSWRGPATGGENRLTVSLMPTWSIVDSRVWKAQIGYLSRHFDVITFDGRGCGRSDRPTEARYYADDEFGEDAIAVLDAVGVDVAVLVGLSCGVTYSLHAVARPPERVADLFAISPSCGLGSAHPEREVYTGIRSATPAPAGRSATGTTGGAAATRTSSSSSWPSSSRSRTRPSRSRT